MSFPIDQHYVPKFYLKGFANDREKLWVYDFHKSTIWEQRPKTLAVIPRFYTETDESGNPSVGFDSFLSYLEGMTKPIIDKLTSGQSLSDKEAGTFSYFLAYMLVRVPSWKTKIEREFVQLVTSEREKLFGTLEATEETIRKYTIRENKQPQHDAKELHNIYTKGDWKIEISNNFLVKMMAEIGKDLVQPIYDLEWKVLHAPLKGAFITSDNPMSILSPFDFDNDGKPVGGILEDKVYKIFPLNKRVCLHIGFKQDRSFEHVRIHRKAIRWLNLTIVCNCQRFLYSPNKKVLESLLKRTIIIDFRSKLTNK